MLKQRIITALILLAALLPAMFHPGVAPFAALCTLMVGAAGWEWARLNGSDPRGAVVWGVALALVLAGFWAVGGLERSWPALWGVSTLAWTVLALVMLVRGVQGWGAWPAAARRVGGAFLLAVAWLALVQAHQRGLSFLLSVLTMVWAADIAAYAGGRAFGRRKLAPSLSPGKSWEGVYSGLLGVFLLGLLWLWIDGLAPDRAPSLFGVVWGHGALWSVLAVLLLTSTSVVGDLLESLVKRSAGMKDSSQLLPGHGGVLDRVDALLPVLPLAMLIGSSLTP
jgi:phosphatidate cytidylyltransferase